jgi:excisionase family DNA binding protein
MAFKKYINTTEAAKLAGCPYNEILNLAKTGVLPCHKTHRGHYRLNVDAVEKYFGIQINKPAEVEEKPAPRVMPRAARVQPRYVEVVTKPAPSKKHTTLVGTHLITNENHYQEVIERICAAKSSVRIMTANFKRFKLKPTDKQGDKYNDGTPFIKYLMAKAVQGVSVQIICSRPSPSFTEEWKEYYQQMGKPDIFDYKFCERNHAKVVIIDDKLAYLGSANITPAGLGQGIFTPGNFEAGILTEEPALVLSIKELFTKVWDGDYCEGCHRTDKCEE